MIISCDARMSSAMRILDLAELLLQQGKFKKVYQILEDAPPLSNDSFELVNLWDKAHYKQREMELKRSLTPIIKFRIRKRFPPPRSICPSGERPCFKLPQKARDMLLDWITNHYRNPYPSSREKQRLAIQTGLKVSQVSTWFSNARRRIADVRKYRTIRRNLTTTDPVCGSTARRSISQSGLVHPRPLDYRTGQNNRGRRQFNKPCSSVTSSPTDRNYAMHNHNNQLSSVGSSALNSYVEHHCDYHPISVTPMTEDDIAVPDGEDHQCNITCDVSGYARDGAETPHQDYEMFHTHSEIIYVDGDERENHVVPLCPVSDSSPNLTLLRPWETRPPKTTHGEPSYNSTMTAGLCPSSHGNYYWPDPISPGTTYYRNTAMPSSIYPSPQQYSSEYITSEPQDLRLYGNPSPSLPTGSSAQGLRSIPGSYPDQIRSNDQLVPFVGVGQTSWDVQINEPAVNVDHQYSKLLQGGRSNVSAEKALTGPNTGSTTGSTSSYSWSEVSTDVSYWSMVRQPVARNGPMNEEYQHQARVSAVDHGSATDQDGFVPELRFCVNDQPRNQVTMTTKDKDKESRREAADALLKLAFVLNEHP